MSPLQVKNPTPRSPEQSSFNRAPFFAACNTNSRPSCCSGTPSPSPLLFFSPRQSSRSAISGPVICASAAVPTPPNNKLERITPTSNIASPTNLSRFLPKFPRRCHAAAAFGNAVCTRTGRADPPRGEAAPEPGTDRTMEKSGTERVGFRCSAYISGLVLATRGPFGHNAIWGFMFECDAARLGRGDMLQGRGRQASALRLIQRACMSCCLGIRSALSGLFASLCGNSWVGARFHHRRCKGWQCASELLGDCLPSITSRFIAVGKTPFSRGLRAEDDSWKAPLRRCSAPQACSGGW
jgi:hypothetical protein